MIRERTVGNYRAVLPDEESDAHWAGWLDSLPARVAEAEHVLARGRNRVVRLADPSRRHGDGDIVVKMLGRQSAWKDRIDYRQGSKAARSWRIAVHLADQIGNDQNDQTDPHCVQRNGGQNKKMSSFKARPHGRQKRGPYEVDPTWSG